MSDPRTAAGALLTADILEAVAPLVDGKPADLVFEAIAAVMLATVLLVSKSPADHGRLLRRYAQQLLVVAAAQERGQ